MIVSQVPMLTDIGILYPYVRILFRQRNLNNGILYEDTGMWLTVKMHDLALIVHQILKTQSRGNHLKRSTEMIELATGQGDDGHLQLT